MKHQEASGDVRKHPKILGMVMELCEAPGFIRMPQEVTGSLKLSGNAKTHKEASGSVMERHETT